MMVGTARAHPDRQAIIGRRKAGQFRCWRSTVASPTSSRLEPSWRKADAHDRADPRPALCAGPAIAIIEGKINTVFLISYHLPLENAPAGYKLFHDHQDDRPLPTDPYSDVVANGLCG
jgi:hypothetical protein